MQEVGKSTSKQMDNFLIQRFDEINLIAGSSTLKSAPIEAEYGLARYLNTFEQFDSLIFTDINGQVIAHKGTVLLNGAHTNLHDAIKDWFAQVKQNQKLLDYAITVPGEAERYLVYATQVVHDGVRYGWLFGQVDSEKIAEISIPIKIGETGRVTLFNDEGILIGHERKDRYGTNMSHYPILKKPLNELKGDDGSFFVSGDGRVKWGMTLLLPQSMDKLNLRWGIIVDQTKDEIYAPIQFLAKVLWIIGIKSLIISLVILYFGSAFIVKPIKNITFFIKDLGENLDFSSRLKITAQDEVGQMSDSINRLLTQISQGMTEANAVVGAIAKGQFDQRITANLKGDLNRLKQGVNASANSVDFSMKELSKVMQALHNGDFSMQMDDRVEGEFRTLVQNAMNSMNATVTGIIHVMENMENGKFQRRIDVEARGDLLKLKNSINRSMDSLEGAIKDITRIVVAQSEGDLTLKISAQYHGELLILKDAVNTTADKLLNVVSQANNASDIVSAAAQEVSSGSISLSQRVQEQAAALEEVSATMDQMNSAVQTNTQNARQTAQEAQKVQAKADQGAAVMQKTIKAMSSIQESSHKIAEIVTLIDGIAFQTNLLALNAAVEAARAGDHGRGFAVVASEVRALAQKSAEAAKDIKGLINESVERIDQGTQLASESGEVLQGINGSINGVAEMINQIAKASSEQADGIKQVHTAIAQIDGVTQQNAALVEETSASSESLSEQARILQQDMAFFKTSATRSSLMPPKQKLPVKSGLVVHQKQTKPEHDEWSNF